MFEERKKNDTNGLIWLGSTETLGNLERYSNGEGIPVKAVTSISYKSNQSDRAIVN